MKIQTLSVVVGSSACDADCPFCVSHMTGYDEIPKRDTPINRRNLKKAVSLAKMGGCTTVLFTGKGEPTLYPKELTTYLQQLKEWGDPIPLLELQTNAIGIGQMVEASHSCKFACEVPEHMLQLMEALTEWYELGLNTIAISVVGIDELWNKQVYLNHRPDRYPALERTVAYLRSIGYSIRLCVMMQNGMVDSPEKVVELINWCRDNDVAQLTVRPIRKPVGEHEESPYFEYIHEHGLTKQQETEIQVELGLRGSHILTLMHGAHAAKVYDVDGQNICISDCLTVEATTDDIRTLIYYADGKICFDWQHGGARIL